jgi:hypothetical protein
MSTTDFHSAPIPGYTSPSDLVFRSSAMYHQHYQLSQEIHRERLRQAERYRLRRAALRARRALAQQLMR